MKGSGPPFLAAALLFLLCAPAEAQIFPAKPMRLVVCQQPGSVDDMLAREIAQPIAAALSQPVLIEYRSGAAGLVGAEHVARSAPDGYTLLLTTPDVLFVRPRFNPDARFDPLEGFTPISKLGLSHHVLVIDAANLPASNVRDFIAAARGLGSSLRFGSAGNGSLSHLAGVQLNRMAGLDGTHIPYKGGTWALADLVGRRLHYVIADERSVRAMLRRGGLRMLAVTSPQRAVALPQLPTLAEAGVPGYELTAWHGLFAAGKTSSAIVAVLNAPLITHLRLPETARRLLLRGVEPASSSAEDFARSLRDEAERYAKLIEAARNAEGF
jgi:tripartite-type tricarboxylate transporter receptor subunit TctC